jgi:agmatine/peptidylarginine deiminase
MRRLLAVSAALFLSLLGCDATPVQDSESPVAAATKIEDRSTIPQVFIAPDGTERIRRIPGVVEYIHYPDDVMLPAHRTAAEYIVQKGDAYDDLRYAAPERHALTIPPVKAVRPMVEWEPMQAIMMGVPSYVLSAGSSNTLDTVVQIAKNAATVAQVWFVVPNTASKNSLEGALLAAGMSQQLITSQVRYMIQAIDSIWFIDYGPLPVLDSRRAAWSFVDFRYYHQRALDDGMPSWIGRNLSGIGVASNVNDLPHAGKYRGRHLPGDDRRHLLHRHARADLYGLRCQRLHLEPRVSLARRRCSRPARRSCCGRRGAQYAGCKDLITMYSITDDGTGHIDMFLKVLDDETVLMADYRAPYANTAQQTNAARMDANAAFLEAYVKPNGKKFKVKRIIMPGHREGTPFTYANSTLINGLNLWPAFTFSDWVSSRNTAEAEWEAALPDYQHIWIDSEELSFNSGAIHCITRTIPATAAAKWIADGSCSGDTCVAPANGYSGDCTPNGIASQVCYGPQWLCGCNDCDSACPGSGGTNDACGAVTLVGCCDGSNLKYCENNALGGLVCTNGCGWNATSSWYDCGYTGSDPSGNNPRSCSPDWSVPPVVQEKPAEPTAAAGAVAPAPSGQTCSASGLCATHGRPLRRRHLRGVLRQQDHAEVVRERGRQPEHVQRRDLRLGGPLWLLQLRYRRRGGPLGGQPAELRRADLHAAVRGQVLRFRRLRRKLRELLDLQRVRRVISVRALLHAELLGQDLRLRRLRRKLRDLRRHQHVQRGRGVCGQLCAKLLGQDLWSGRVRRKLRDLRRGRELHGQSVRRRLRAELHGQGVWSRRVRRELRDVQRGQLVQRVGHLCRRLRAELHGQGVWSRRVRRELRDVQRGQLVQRVGHLCRRLRAELHGQGVRSRRMRRELRDLLGRADLHGGREMPRELRAAVHGEGVRRRRLWRKLRDVWRGAVVYGGREMRGGLRAKLRWQELRRRRVRRKLRELRVRRDMQRRQVRGRLCPALRGYGVRGRRLRRGVRELRGWQ